jgi:hypothetical protein
MHTHTIAVVLVAAGLAVPSLAFAQRVPFERAFDVPDAATLEVTTVRGRITIVAGDPGRIVVAGEVTVRVGWDVPANAADLAREIAASPPVVLDGAIVRAQPPPDPVAQRAVTVSYEIRVPPGTTVRSVSDSGATSVTHVTGAVDVQTHTGAIALTALGGTVVVSSGSGAIRTDAIAGALQVTTTSGAFTGSQVGSSLRVRTQSGDVDAALTGHGDVDVETGSSAIRLRGVDGGALVKTQSGQVTIDGAPARAWTVRTSSSAVTMSLTPDSRCSIDAATRSGSITVSPDLVQGTIAKRAVAGAVRGGGPVVLIRSGSGSIRIQDVLSRQSP